jgi:hypothetical protein
VTSDRELQRKISTSLQFPGGISAISGAPSRDFATRYFSAPSRALAGVFTRDPRSQRRYAGGKLDNLLVCYRFFKALRNAIAHNGGRANNEVLNSYARFKPIATGAALGLKEAPIHSPISQVGDLIHLNLRGVTGLSNIILHIVTTYDTDFGETRPAEREVAARVKQASGEDRRTITTRSPKREQQIIARVRSANLPSVNLTPAFEKFLKSEGLIPSYA